MLLSRQLSGSAVTKAAAESLFPVPGRSKSGRKPAFVHQVQPEHCDCPAAVRLRHAEGLPRYISRAASAATVTHTSFTLRNLFSQLACLKAVASAVHLLLIYLRFPLFCQSSTASLHSHLPGTALLQWPNDRIVQPGTRAVRHAECGISSATSTAMQRPTKFPQRNALSRITSLLTA